MWLGCSMFTGFNRLPEGSDFFVGGLGQFAKGGEEQGRVALADEALHQRRYVSGSVIYIGQKHNRSGRILVAHPLGNVAGRDVRGEAVIEKHGVYLLPLREVESAHGHKDGQASEPGRFHDQSIDLQMRWVVVDEENGNLLVHWTSDSRGIEWNNPQYHNPYEFFSGYGLDIAVRE